VIFCLAVTISVLLIILIKNVIRTINNLNLILTNNSDGIEKTITALPSAIQSIEGVADSAKVTLDKATSVVSTVEDSVTETIDSFSLNAENIVNIINVASAVVKSIMNAFSSTKNK
jgi:prophage DNA circulation protein